MFNWTHAVTPLREKLWNFRIFNSFTSKIFFFLFFKLNLNELILLGYFARLWGWRIFCAFMTVIRWDYLWSLLFLNLRVVHFNLSFGTDVTKHRILICDRTPLALIAFVRTVAEWQAPFDL